jgi:ArsR family transcriptional regulator
MSALTLTDISIASCAPEGLTSAIAREQAETLSSLLKVVADPTRLQLLALINSAPDAETCACNLTGPLGLSQPTISHHLKVLTDSGLLNREKRGTWVWYSVNQERWNELANLFAA